MSKKILIPFTKNTNQFLNFPMFEDNIEWKENQIFEDRFKIDSFSRGRSAANFNVISEINGKSYTMFMKDLFDIIQTHKIEKGIVSGFFTFCKRGRNYGVKMMSF